MRSDSTKRLRDRGYTLQSKLDILLDITTSINENYSKNALFLNFKNILIEELNIGKFSFYFYDTAWQLVMNEGVDKTIAEAINPLTLLSNYSEIEVLGASESDILSSYDVIIPIYNKNIVTAYLLLADLDDKKGEVSPIIKHLKFIQTLGNIIAVALENKQLLKSQIKQLGMQKELELAQKMQTMLFPKKLPQNKDLAVKAFYQPHYEIGGDYYDVIQISEDKTAICIADISGKGISAAILMASFQATLHALLSFESNDLKKLIEAANQKVIDAARYEKFITLFIAIYDSKNNSLNYINAGHQPAILYQNGNYKLLSKGCTVLGMFDKLPEIETETISLNTNDKLYCYTDGISEIIVNGGKQLEVSGIIEHIEKHGNKIDIVVANISTLIQNKNKEKEREDDITFLAAHFRPRAFV